MASIAGHREVGTDQRIGSVEVFQYAEIGRGETLDAVTGIAGPSVGS
jgi:acyl-[acyl carrier protein]--UDP-N-acetylglucosamine O-acyltransferase